VAVSLIQQQQSEIQVFLNGLEKAIKRRITTVIVTPLHGTKSEWKNASEAISFLASYNVQITAGPVLKYEIDIKYSNGDKISAEFESKDDAIQFLQRYK
jgi:hypothetical protein